MAYNNGNPFKSKLTKNGYRMEDFITVYTKLAKLNTRLYHVPLSILFISVLSWAVRVISGQKTQMNLISDQESWRFSSLALFKDLL